ncbi:endonuclease/exonuclease/phosphatase family protein [Bifidobacterium sp.]|jgi:endonuclease/exonuclease/phosphatase family metal-dependent hydrolase|uniref:endonuclease/exonuclease/phosphatase family protein n=1 Tax=Bifidobacterium sp. TaxID=41200 RepID=UPI0025C43D5E|nr:endonuclease/exonuclease/phosphatase family protein [Bifidobacterium sp.]MCH4208912.1 endonuclease/exonuclease/phosphatase family protein [Bifidobacterium sp.]MCI1224459.1 endonuclease/exonuclease/phosphatase family protein [Bifidobacterium sp.]
MISWLLPAALFIVAAWSALRFLPAGAEASGALPYLIALAPLLWIPAGAITVWSLAAQQWWMACVSSVITALIAAVEWRAYRRNAAAAGNGARNAAAQHTAAIAHERGDVIQVMTLNCRYGRADPQAIMDAVRNEHIQVLALQELTEDLVRRLGGMGLNKALPYHSIGAPGSDDNGGFNGIWSAFAPLRTDVAALSIPGAEVPCLTIAADAVHNAAALGRSGDDDDAGVAPAITEGSDTIRFFSAHPKSPMRGTRQWSTGVTRLAQLRSSSPHEASVIMGDLNSHIDHPSFRHVLAAGFRDANRCARSGPVATFPRLLPWPRIELDHILADHSVAISHTRTHTIPGSDHLALAATLHV